MRRGLLKAGGFRGIKIIGSRFMQDTNRIRDMHTKNKTPFTWLDVEKDEQVEQLLEQFEIELEDTRVAAIGQDTLLKIPPTPNAGKHWASKKGWEKKISSMI